MRVLLCLVAAAATFCGCSDLGVSGGGSSSTAGAVSAAAAAPTPQVVFDAPARGAFLSPGPVLVSGHVLMGKANVPVVSVEVDGQPVTLNPNGSFSTTLNIATGATTIQAVCTDSEGARGGSIIGVLAGTFKPINEPILQAGGVRLNEPALNALGKIIELSLWSTDLTRLLQNAGSLYETNFLFLQAWVDVVLVRYHDLRVSIDSTANGLKVRAVAVRPVIDTNVDASIGFGSRFGPSAARLEANEMVVEATLKLAPSNTEPVDVTISDVTLTLTNFGVTTASPLIQLVLPLVESAVRDALTTEIRKAIADDLPPVLSQLITDYLAPPQGFDILGKPFRYNLEISKVDHDDLGIGLEIGFNANPLQWTSVASTAPGSLVTPGALPLLRTHRGLRIAVDDDGLNRLFFGFWASGILDIDVDQRFFQDNGISVPLDLTVASFSQFLPQLSSLASPTTPVVLRVEPKLPPIVTVRGTPSLLDIDVNELHITIMLDHGNGQLETVLRTVAHASLGAGVAFQDYGLKVSSATTPVIGIDVIEEPVIEFDDRQIEIMLGIVLTPMLPEIVNGTKPLGIPHINQLTVFDVMVGADGSSGDHLLVEADLLR